MAIATSLSAKLLSGFGVVLVLLLATASVALWQMRVADVAANQISGNYLPSIRCLGGMDAAANQLRRLLYGQACAETPAEIQAHVEQINATVASFESCLAEYAALEMGPDERGLFEQVRQQWEPVKAAIAPIQAAARSLDLVEALKVIATSNEAAGKLIAAIERLVAINDQEAQQARLVQAQAVQRGYWITGVSVACALAAGIGSALFIARRMVRPVAAVRGTLDALAGGDLTRRVEVAGQDEVAAMAGALNATLDGLRGSVGSITQGAQGVAAAAEQLSVVSRQLNGNADTASAQSGQAAAAANEVAASIATIASGVEELGASVGEIAKNAGDAAGVAKDGVAAAAEADQAMGRLASSTAEIGDIVKLITGIAEQTNLLALNATIEAARAGDAGRGFAVVASEVKELARKTSEATGDIGKRIAGIQTESQSAQDALRRIREIVDRIDSLQQSIASAVEEQSATTRELAGNVSQVAQAGTGIAANVATVASAAKEASAGAGEGLKSAQELARLAAELRQSVARFRT